MNSFGNENEMNFMQYFENPRQKKLLKREEYVIIYLDLEEKYEYKY